MNTITRTLPLALLGSALLFPAGLSAASYTKAEVTRLHNEVKVLKENAAPREAVVGDEISSVTSVATGAASRAELKFPDNSLTVWVPIPGSPSAGTSGRWISTKGSCCSRCRSRWVVPKSALLP